MYLLLLFLCITYFIRKELKQCKAIEKEIFFITLLIEIVLAIIYRSYLINLGFEYGLANLDMVCFNSLAEDVSHLSFRDGVIAISDHWNFINANSVQIWGYRLYIYLLSFFIYRWSFFDAETSIYLVSIAQVSIASLSSLIVYNSIKKEILVQPVLSLVLILSAPSIWFGSVRLLRESWMYLCIALIIRFYITRKKNWELWIIIPIALLALFRAYYLVLVVPLCLLLNRQIKLACFVSLVFFSGAIASCLYTRTPLTTVIGVVLSPNFFNQIQLMRTSTYEYTLNTGYIPLINFCGAIWNLFMLTFLVAALFQTKKNTEMFCCFIIIITLCTIYAIAHGGSTELRHKLFFVIPYIIILNIASEGLNKKGLLHFYIVTFISFIFVYSLLYLSLGG